MGLNPPYPTVDPEQKTGLTAPFLLVLLCLGAGIVWARTMPVPLWAAGAGMGGVLAVAGLALLTRCRRLAVLGLSLCFLVGGAVLQRKEQNRYAAMHAKIQVFAKEMGNGDVLRMEGETLTLPVPDVWGEAIEASVRVRRVWCGDMPQLTDFPVQLRIRLSSETPVEWHRGDQIHFLARLSLPRGFRNSGGLPIYIYYWNRDIVGLASCKSPQLLSVLAPGRENPLDRLFRKTELLIDTSISPQLEREVIKALLLGRNIATPELRSAYINAGIFHILVISGFHLTLIAITIGAILAAGRLPRAVRYIALALLLLAYLIFVQAGVSITRAYLMILLVIAGRLFYKQTNLLNATALAAVLLLAWEPWYILDAGFLLTFSAVFALALISPPLERSLVGPISLAATFLFSDRLDLEEGPERRWGRRLRFALEQVHFFYCRRMTRYAFARFSRPALRAAAWIGRLLVATIAVLCLTGPVLASIHFPLALEGLAASVPATLLVWPVQVLLLSALVVLPFWPDGAAFLMHGSAVFAGWLNQLVLKIPFSPVWSPRPGIIATAVFLGFLFWCLYGRRRRVGLAMATLALFIAYSVYQPTPRPECFNFVMLDVGEGDCFLLETPEGDHVLVDTGGVAPRESSLTSISDRADLSRRVIIPFLLEQGIRKLDALVLSHFDFDHAGSAASLLRSFPVKQVYCSAAEWQRFPPLAQAIGTAAAATRTPIHPLTEGARLCFHRLALQVISPADTAYIVKNDNRNSLVCYATYDQASILLTGDIDTWTESRLDDKGLLQAAAVLKAAHHGSATSNSVKLLERVQPRLVLISSGAPWVFAHPGPVVIERLNQLGIPWVSTYQVGEIDLALARGGMRLTFPFQTARAEEEIRFIR